MTEMTMRDRILAVVRGESLDRVPFVMYDGMLPNDEVRDVVGRDRLGLMRWCKVYRVEHPHCHIESEDYYRGEKKWQRNTLHTPVGSIYEERAFETAYDSSSVRRHYIQEPADYEVFWAYLEDCVILENYGQFHRDQHDLGDAGVPLVSVERTPYQQLWVRWTGLENLGFHMVDCPDRVAHTVHLLTERAEAIFRIMRDSPAPFVDFPDNITAPTIGPSRFTQYCVPLYNRLADMLDDRGVPVFVHMDGDLKPLWQAISDSRVGGIDSLAPAPDNDTSVAQAASMWPEMRLFVNFPSSVHLRPYGGVRAVADEMLRAAGHTGRLQMQISENVPHGVWRTSLPAIADAIDAFGRP